MKGIYLLLIGLNKNIKINIGSLGNRSFKKGEYLYVGSAQINLKKRIKRHLSDKKRIYWHIDYLLSLDSVKIKKVYYKKISSENECIIARTILKNSQPIKGFGCSDCKCVSHLFKIKLKNILRELNFKELNLIKLNK